jgi:hypothetical protein
MPKKHRLSKEAKILIQVVLDAAKNSVPPISEAALARRADITPVTLSLMKRDGRGDIAVISDMAKSVGLKLALVPDDDLVETLQNGSYFDD